MYGRHRHCCPIRVHAQLNDVKHELISALANNAMVLDDVRETLRSLCDYVYDQPPPSSPSPSTSTMPAVATTPAVTTPAVATAVEPILTSPLATAKAESMATPIATAMAKAVGIAAQELQVLSAKRSGKKPLGTRTNVP